MSNSWPSGPTWKECSRMDAVNARLRFGIPSLDAIFVGLPEQKEKDYQRLDWGGLMAPEGQSTSFCLIGPDGTGKSVFALYFASQYLTDNHVGAKCAAKVCGKDDSQLCTKHCAEDCAKDC